MDRELERVIAYHCAPVIRGIKMANLVSVPQHVGEALSEFLREYNEKCNHKGLYFQELCRCRERRLLLVFRPALVESYIRMHAHMDFLSRYGYTADETLAAHLERLGRRVVHGVGFPHEIGLFLGYPLEDVKGFIHHRGAGYRICGEWKVYGHGASAERTFYCFRVCREFCLRRLEEGGRMDELVAVTA